ncbi:MAG: 3'-5' exonuclease [Desulfomonile tiedjei]|nr:3'-5' exonuclease [Desulfomonile tiedjei]
MTSRWSWLWARSPAKHEFLRQNESLFASFEQGRPIEDYEFVCFDTELTGLNPRRDTIVSIGAVRIKDLRIVVGDNFFTYVHPERDLPKDSTLIHQITPEQLENAPKLGSVLPAFVEFCGEALLVGHYVNLDMAFVNKAMRKAMGGTLHNPCVDSMRLAQAFHEHRHRTYNGRPIATASYNLTHLAEEFDLPRFTKHDALEDALQTAYLFLFLVKNLRAEGFVTLKDFYRAGKTGPHQF